MATEEQAKLERGSMGDSASAASSTTPPSDKKCWACGETAHSDTNSHKSRSESCKAWSAECLKCEKKGHYSSCCAKCTDCGTFGHRNKGNKVCPHNKKASEKGEAGIIGDHSELCFVQKELSRLGAVTTTRRNQDTFVLSHHIFDKNRGWIQTPSKPHPTIMAKVTISPRYHEAFGYLVEEQSHLKQVYSPMVTDSGCQSTVMPAKTVYSKGLKKADFLPVRMSMTGAGSDNLEIMGGVILDIEMRDSANNVRVTRKAMEDLGIMRENFPEPIPIKNNNTSSCNGCTVDKSSGEECICPKRTPHLPQLPESLPEGFTGTDEEVPALKEWLLEQYGPTAFNNCEYQQLPQMTGQPLRTHIDPKVTVWMTQQPGRIVYRTCSRHNQASGHLR